MSNPRLASEARRERSNYSRSNTCFRCSGTCIFKAAAAATRHPCTSSSHIGCPSSSGKYIEPFFDTEFTIPGRGKPPETVCLSPSWGWIREAKLGKT